MRERFGEEGYREQVEIASKLICDVCKQTGETTLAVCVAMCNKAIDDGHIEVCEPLIAAAVDLTEEAN